MMYRGPKRRDANQRKIVAALRRLGMSVVITADVGGGFPDLVVGYRGVTYLVEVKNATKLRKKQIAFREAWKGGPVWVLRNLDDVLHFYRHISRDERRDNTVGDADAEEDPSGNTPQR